MSEPAVALVERARAHLAAAAAPLTPHAVAEALRGAGPVGHDTVLAVHARLVRDVEGADPVSLIAYDKVMITVDAVKKFEEALA